MEAIPLQEASVDALVCVYAFHEMPEDARLAAVEEFYRCVRHHLCSVYGANLYTICLGMLLLPLVQAHIHYVAAAACMCAQSTAVCPMPPIIMAFYRLLII